MIIKIHERNLDTSAFRDKRTLRHQRQSVEKDASEAEAGVETPAGDSSIFISFNSI
jgi:hypothetical protein